jgi:hypothetical protein
LVSWRPSVEKTSGKVRKAKELNISDDDSEYEPESSSGSSTSKCTPAPRMAKGRPNKLRKSSAGGRPQRASKLIAEKEIKDEAEKTAAFIASPNQDDDIDGIDGDLRGVSVTPDTTKNSTHEAEEGVYGTVEWDRDRFNGDRYLSQSVNGTEGEQDSDG